MLPIDIVGKLVHLTTCLLFEITSMTSITKLLPIMNVLTLYCTMCVYALIYITFSFI